MDTEIRVSTESWPRRRKFSCQDSNPRIFHESSTLATALSLLPILCVASAPCIVPSESRRETKTYSLPVCCLSSLCCTQWEKKDLELVFLSVASASYVGDWPHIQAGWKSSSTDGSCWGSCFAYRYICDISLSLSLSLSFSLSLSLSLSLPLPLS